MASVHRSRQWLEAFKFGVYVGAPIFATYALAFGATPVLERAIEDRAYVSYPPEGPKPPSMRDVELGRAETERRRAQQEAAGPGRR